MKLSTHPGVARFVELVRAYRALLIAPRALVTREFLVQLHACLAQLYAAALELPAVQPERTEGASDQNGSPTWHELRATLQGQLGSRDYYSEMFAPYELQGQEPVIGSLSDDLADIFVDLGRGLAAWDAKTYDAAVWEWGFHFDHHWGEHATGALRALHALRAISDYAEPDIPKQAV